MSFTTTSPPKLKPGTDCPVYMLTIDYFLSCDGFLCECRWTDASSRSSRSLFRGEVKGRHTHTHTEPHPPRPSINPLEAAECVSKSTFLSLIERVIKWEPTRAARAGSERSKGTGTGTVNGSGNRRTTETMVRIVGIKC